MASIYEMNLHEVLNIHCGNTLAKIKVMRVPGGWIYTFTLGEAVSSTFVPFTSPEKQYGK